MVKKNTPFLGICLGLQLLFERSDETPGVEGLGILKGEIFLFNKLKKVISFALIFTALSVNTYASELSSWAKEDYTNASRSQLIPFSVGAKSMGENITREQFCELIVNTYESISGKQIPESSKNPFSDCENQTVINAYGVGLVGGTSENSFSPENFVTRQEMAKMLFNMLVATELEKLGSKEGYIRARAESMGIKIIDDADIISEEALVKKMKTLWKN